MPVDPNNQPRSFCGGLALPPRQTPQDLSRPAVPTTIVTGIAGAVTGAYGAVRRAIATQGVS